MKYIGSLCLAFVVCAVGAAELPGRPFVLINNDELVTLRAQLAQPGWKHRAYRAADGVRANADLWVKRPVAIPERGGHFHNFFCEDGDMLESPRNQRFDPGPYCCAKCGREYVGEKYAGAMRRFVHFWLARASFDLAFVSAIEQKPGYAEKSAEILLKYADAYPGPHTSNVAGGMIYQSLDESMWVIPLAQAYDLIHSQLSESDRTRIEKFLRTAAQGIQQCGLGGNWGSWHLSAVGVVGYAIGDEALVKWATESFQQQIRDQLGDDGLWPESVHTYHYFPLSAFLSFAEAAWHAGVDLYNWEGRPGKSLAQMLRAPLAYAYPDLRLAAINDGWFASFVPPDLYELAWFRLEEPQFAYVLANGYRPEVVPAGTADGTLGTKRDGLYALLFGARIPAKVPSPTLGSVNFPVLGIAALRSANGAMMTFDYGPFLGHGQRDKMGITIFAHGRLLSADYGTPGYGSRILEWYASTFSHNTVVVDGKSQQPTQENGARLWLGDDTIEAVQSRTAEAYPGVTHTRTVVRVGDCFVVSDSLTSDSPHTYDFYLHAEGKLSLVESGAGQKATDVNVQFVEEPTAFSPRNTVSGRWRQRKGGLAFWIAGSDTVIPITARCPADTASRQVPLLIVRQTAAHAKFVAVLFPYDRKRDLRVEQRGDELEIRTHEFVNLVKLPSGEEGPSSIRRRIDSAGF